MSLSTSGAVPNVYTALEHVINTIHEAATAKAITAYEEQMTGAGAVCTSEAELNLRYTTWHHMQLVYSTYHLYNVVRIVSFMPFLELTHFENLIVMP